MTRTLITATDLFVTGSIPIVALNNFGNAVVLSLPTGSVSSSVQILSNQISGTQLASNVTTSSLTSVGSLASLTVTGNLSVDAGTLFVDSLSNRVGIGTLTPFAPFDLVFTNNSTNPLNSSAQLHAYTNQSVSNNTYTLTAYRTDVGGTELGLFGMQSIDRSALRADFVWLNGPGLSKVERMRINSSGSVGIGTVPSAWDATGTALQVGTYGALSSRLVHGINTNLTNNVYYTNAGWRYIASQEASLLRFNRNTMAYLNATSGTAGDVVTFVERMRIDANGRVGIGTGSPSSMLQIHATSSNSPNIVMSNTDVAVSGKISGLYFYSRDPSNDWYSGMDSYVPAGSPGVDRTDLRFYTTNITPGERMRITSAGNVGIGTTSVGGKLTIADGNSGISIQQNDLVRRFVRTLNGISQSSFTVSIPFTSQGSAWTNHYIEIKVAASANGINSSYGGLIGYVVHSLTGMGIVTAYNGLTGLSASANNSGTTFSVTFTGTTFNHAVVHVTIVTSNPIATCDNITLS